MNLISSYVSSAFCLFYIMSWLTYCTYTYCVIYLLFYFDVLMEIMLMEKILSVQVLLVTPVNYGIHVWYMILTNT